jgi:hypothetical protein
MDAAWCRAARRVVADDIANQVPVTFNAVSLQNPQAHGAKADRLGEVLQGKAFGVPEAIFRLDQVLWNYLMRTWQSLQVATAW